MSKTFAETVAAVGPIRVSHNGVETVLKEQKQDSKYFHRQYSIGYTEGNGTEENPYMYLSAADASPHYAIVDLAYAFGQSASERRIWIKVNDWKLELTPEFLKALGIES